MYSNDTFKYEIKEKIAVLGEKDGRTKELNLISFRGFPAKYDLRTWSDGNMGKGITLTAPELQRLKDVLNGMTIKN